jgi:hypothetical protein
MIDAEKPSFLDDKQYSDIPFLNHEGKYSS